MNMTYKKTKEHPLDEPEVALNLWAYTDESGTIMRIAGRTYVVEGTEEQKLSKLRALSGSDFLAAAWFKVPKNFSIVGEGGRKMEGVAHASLLSNPDSHSALFGQLIDGLERQVPEQLRCIKGEYEKFRMDVPKDPLTVTTVVIERDDGTLVPMVSIS